MLSTNKLRSIYSKIQTQLFYMIPEKWDKIYLYASIIEQVNHLETGEMFFYYYPAGILKKNPVNVYEIPNKFNIEEEEYSKLVNKLYATLNELREAFKESTEEKMWSNFTITIADAKFNIEYNYEDLLGSDYTSYDRHIIWMCKYLDYPIERLSRKDKKMLKEYYESIEQKKIKTKIYTEGMYKKKVHNIIEYSNERLNKEDVIEEIEKEYEKSKEKKAKDYEEKQNKTELKNAKKEKYNNNKQYGPENQFIFKENYNNYENTYKKDKEKKKDKYEQYKLKQETKKQKEKKKKEEFEKELEPTTKNQILNF